MLRLLSVIAICAGLFCLSQSNAQVPLTGAGPSGGLCSPSQLSFDFTTASLPGAITFTRASSGSYFNSSNVLQVFGAATNTARFDYTASGSTAYLLYEPAATNLVLQSNTFTSATWSKINSAVITAGAATSPDGTADASSMVSASNSGAVFQAITYSAASYVGSIWGQGIATTRLMQIYVSGTASSNISIPNGSWTRAAFVHTTSAGSGNQIYADNDAATSLYIFGAQTELTPASLSTPGPTSYIPTTTVAVTRAADQATFTIPSCVGHLTVTFDDNSTQSIVVSPGSYTLTNTLNRYDIKTIVGAS